MKTITKLWIFLAVLIILTPLGIIIPAYFKAGPALGEKISVPWNSPLLGYGSSNTAYVISAIIGILAAAGIVYLLGKFLTKKDQ
jgi:hypothetical protein